MLGERLVEKLDVAVCCRVCHPAVTFLENVNCKSCVSSKKEVYCYPTACICDRTFSPFAFTFVFWVPAACLVFLFFLVDVFGIVQPT